LAEPWDNVGLMIGDPSQEVSGILLGLDPTAALLEEALTKNSNLIITHHPAIFHPLKAIRTDQPVGRFLAQALKNDVAVVGCHTNLDVIQHGVSQVLAAKIGLTRLTPLVATETGAAEIGFGRIGSLQNQEAPDIFLARLCEILQLPALRICGPVPAEISRVAVCGGSGSDLAEAALSQKAQIYITGEVKHSTARWAEASGLCIIDAGHFATENLVVPAFATVLEKMLQQQQINIPVHTADNQNNPFFYYLNP
jgi:dinuclear metal center YbgI/SA1388 family protein